MTSAAKVLFLSRTNSEQSSGGGTALKDEVLHQSWGALSDRILPSGHLFRMPTEMAGGGAAVIQLFERLGANSESSGQVSSAPSDAPVWKSELEALEPNWDDEGAPTPSSDTISMAAEMVDWAERNGLLVECVDADVLGGVAIYLKGPALGKRAWVSLLNNGRRSILIDAGGSVTGRSLDEEGLEWVRAQLVTGDDATG